VATRFAERIDALHGEARQILHCVSLSGLRLCDASPMAGPRIPLDDG
jgi:hypothetical protein